MDWLPTLSEWPGPLYLRIVEAMTVDIANGRLARGQQLPTQRALAHALEIDLTTVTRAYGEGRRRGLLDARVGQGTFVSETTARAPDNIRDQVKIDLSMNLPPQPVEANLDVRIAKGLAAIQSNSSLTAFLNYQSSGGSDEQREVAAKWLRTRVPGATSERVIVYPGTQAIIFNTLLSRTSPGDVVVTEALTYQGLKAAAARLGVKLVGVAMDQEGILPDALARACRKHKPKAVYLVPTLHNPTTATLSLERRKLVANIIRENGTFLIEDDVYGLLEPSASPIFNLIPEHTYLAASLSKCITPALRISFLLVPDAATEEAMRSILHAAMQMTAPLMVALATHWLSSGIGDQITAAVRNEAIGRQKLAGKILQGLSFSARPSGHHLWLSLPTWWSRSDFVAQMLRRGLAVVGSEAFALEQRTAPQAVRVSLGAARNRAELAQALHLIARTVRSRAATMHIV
ncbi:transcriptional regulator, GntR family [Rhizobiales bacterium GAS191]|nr:transcriptional regulator, GntR family [Rhizobiales bacterium GAS191]